MFYFFQCAGILHLRCDKMCTPTAYQSFAMPVLFIFLEAELESLQNVTGSTEEIWKYITIKKNA